LRIRAKKIAGYRYQEATEAGDKKSGLTVGIKNGAEA
jgi:hypothetical protein